MIHSFTSICPIASAMLDWRNKSHVDENCHRGIFKKLLTGKDLGETGISNNHNTTAIEKYKSVSKGLALNSKM